MALGDPDLIDILRNLKTFGLTNPIRDHFQLRLGAVVGINDVKKKGRVCVRILGIDPKINSDNTPNDARNLYWAESVFPTAGDGHGDFFLPSVGDVGFVLFLQGDYRQPTWVGTLVKAPGGQTRVAPEFQEQYDSPSDVPIIRGFTTPAGHKMVVRDRAGDEEIVVETAGGRRLVVRDADSSAGSGAKKGIELKSGGYHIKLNEEDDELDINVPGNASINVSGDCVLNVGGSIKLGDSGLNPFSDGVVTKKHLCAFTGAPHPDASSDVMAK